jgi:hypothetical protein
MELWIVVDSLSNDPEVFSSQSEAEAFALEILEDYQSRWKFEQDEYEEARADITKADPTCIYWGTYLGECEVNIYKKFI